MGIKKEISSWWADNPMTYGRDHGKTEYDNEDGVQSVDFESKEFFQRADEEMFLWNSPLRDETGEFGKVYPFKKYSGKKVLEVGCGMGGMAMLWASHGAKLTACDFNPIAIEQTTRRFELFNLKADIRREDGNSLSFENEIFDYVYSWGVLHHSPDLEKSIAEFFRVLKPGGEFGVMLYNRKSVLHWWSTLAVEGLLHGESRFLDERKIASRYGDGFREEGNPHTWPVTKREVVELFSQYSPDVQTRLLGTELNNCNFLLPGLYRFVPQAVLKCWARRFGWSIWISGRKA